MNNTSIITDFIDMATVDYRMQPIKVTANNIIQEFPEYYPIPKESLLASGIKSYAVSIAVSTFGISIVDLKKDSTYMGQFFQNFVSAGKNLACWALGIKRGTRKYDLERPIADIAKGMCKAAGIYFIPNYKKHAFAINFVCELPSWAFLTGMEGIKHKEQDLLSFSNWYNVLSNKESIAEIVRKSFAQVFAAKITMEYFVHPAKSYFDAATQLILPSSIYNFLGKDLLFYKIPLLPNLSGYTSEIFTGLMLVPVIRTFTYTINAKAEVLYDKDGFLYHAKIGDVLNFAREENVRVNYKYDMDASGAIQGMSNSTDITVHYPMHNDYIGGLIGMIEHTEL